jgi:pimeloyl-ACP methyl ester carboxylesterase
MDFITDIEVGLHHTRVLDTGAGAPVVVLHGWGGRIESMVPVIDCLKEKFRVVALDLPGFGDSPVPTGVWGTPDYAVYVRDVLTKMEIGHAHFVGHSFGAKTSLYLAATHPGIVDKLVLMGSPGIRSAPSLAAQAKRALSKAARTIGRFGPPGRAIRDEVYKRIASQDYREAGPLRPILVKVVNEDLAQFLPAISSPTLLVWGSDDDAVPVAHARIMEKMIPNAGLVVLEGAGHFCYLEEPVRFCRAVRHFFGAPLP